MKRIDIDWEAIEREYRAGIKSIRQIGKEFGLTHRSVGQRAAREGWERNLADKIRQAAKNKLAAEVARSVSAQIPKSVEREIVQANAAIQVSIVREHRVDIQRARKLVQALVGDLERVVGDRDLLNSLAELITADDKDNRRLQAFMRAIGINENASTLESLTRSLKPLIGMEREAFGIDDRNADDVLNKQQITDGISIEAAARIYSERMR